MTRRGPALDTPGPDQNAAKRSTESVYRSEPWPTVVALAEAVASAEAARLCGFLPDDDGVAWVIARGAERVARLLDQVTR